MRFNLITIQYGGDLRLLLCWPSILLYETQRRPRRTFARVAGGLWGGIGLTVGGRDLAATSYCFLDTSTWRREFWESSRDVTPPLFDQWRRDRPGTMATSVYTILFANLRLKQLINRMIHLNFYLSPPTSIGFILIWISMETKTNTCHRASAPSGWTLGFWGEIQ